MSQRPVPGVPTVAEDPKTRRQKEIEATERLLAKSEGLLEDVDGSFLMKECVPRAYPKFERSEVKTGSILGVGGFGVVYEVKDILLKNDTASPINEVIVTHGPGEGGNEVASAISDAMESDMDNASTRFGKSQHGGSHIPPPLDDKHYEISIAREQMSTYVRRNGDARYAIKRLHRDLNDLERTRGKLDLALEAKFLSVLWHPNIGT